ncbi:hypothetical protein PO883_27180 [Massilia sp. DJPM01]|uniref:hypothetical protein n=1 Tax=Massilia sp. DJPM01 TaxID=3024404 RepID=UPI00259DE319|nr:hypothetical protein [Massilia sp. DJPM01]MDM5180870.1 hypothetical protein [Massilia sp. DJPM01]
MNFTHIKQLTAAILFAPLLACAAEPVTELHTSYGKVEVIRNTEPVQLLFAGKKIASIGADSASLIPYYSKGGPEYVVVQTIRADPTCTYVYLMLEVSDEGAKVSKEFGRCRHIAGSGMAGSEPVLHLSNQEGQQAGVETYQWHGADVTLAVESPSICSAQGFLARKNAQPLRAQLVSRVSGSGRLQFLSAPDTNCAMHGVFVVPGDSVTASLAADGYVYVNYTNPKSGRKVQGWVPRERLSDL